MGNHDPYSDRTHLSNSHLFHDLDFALDELQEALRAPLQIMKRRLVEALVQRRLGLTYEAFLANGANIDGDLRREISRDIDNINVEAEIIIAACTTSEWHIFKVAFGHARSEQNFACTGEGAAVAEQALHRRQQMFSSDILGTLYNVYEAKRLSELAPTVGSATDLVILRLNGIWPVSDEGLVVLDDYFHKYGPQPVDALDKFKLKEPHLTIVTRELPARELLGIDD